MTKRKFNNRQLTQLLLLLFFAVTVVFPLIAMFHRITPEGIKKVAGSPQFIPALRNSLTTTLTGTLISLGIAFVCAWSLERSRIHGKEAFRILFVLPMLIPSVSHTFGLVSLFGTNGFFTRLFGWSSGIYGFLGIVIGSVLYSFPAAFLMFSEVLHYEDGSPYQAAEVLGIDHFHQFKDLTLPYLKKTLISAFFATFTLIITDYGVPILIGGKTITISVLMYQKAISQIDYDSGSVLGLILLIPAITAYLVDLIIPSVSQHGYVTVTVQSYKKPFRDMALKFFCVLISLCVIAPIASFLIMVFSEKYPTNPAFTLKHIKKTISRGALSYWRNSLVTSFFCASFGSTLAFICAYLTVRIRGSFNRMIHLIALTSMAIPGLVLGLSYVIFFHNSPFYGTVLIIVLANTMHFFASPYLMMYNSIGKVNPDLEYVGATLDISRFRIIWDVILPKVKGTLIEMFVFFFVNSMMTISAVSFLAPPSPRQIAQMINQYQAQLMMESAAFVSLLIMSTNLILKFIVNRRSIIKQDSDSPLKVQGI